MRGQPEKGIYWVLFPVLGSLELVRTSFKQNSQIGGRTRHFMTKLVVNPISY